MMVVMFSIKAPVNEAEAELVVSLATMMMDDRTHCRCQRTMDLNVV